MLLRSGDMPLSCPILSAMPPNIRMDGSTQPARSILVRMIPVVSTVSAPRAVPMIFLRKSQVQHHHTSIHGHRYQSIQQDGGNHHIQHSADSFKDNAFQSQSAIINGHDIGRGKNPGQKSHHESRHNCKGQSHEQVTGPETDKQQHCQRNQHPKSLWGGHG